MDGGVDLARSERHDVVELRLPSRRASGRSPSRSGPWTTAPTSASPCQPHVPRSAPAASSAATCRPHRPSPTETPAELGLRFTAAGRRLRSPVSASTRARATPAPTSGPCGPLQRPEARLGHVHQRDRHRVADRDLRRRRSRCRPGQTLRGLLHAPPPGTTPPSPAASPRRRTTPVRSTSTVGSARTPAGVFGAAGTLPELELPEHQLLRRRALPRPTDASPLIATNQTPLPDSSSVPHDHQGVGAVPPSRSWPGSAGLALKDATGSTVAGSTSYDATTRTITFTPTAALSGFVKYTATLSAQSTPRATTPTAGKTWSFTTAKPPNAPGVCPCTLFDDDDRAHRARRHATARR